MSSTRNGYTVGQEISFSGKGTIAALYDHNSCLRIDDGDGYTHYVYPGSSKVTHEATTPANWPPQVGDVWKIGSKEYFAREHTMGGDRVVLISDDGQSNFYPSDFGLVAKRNPKLIRRRGL